jgi:phage baseplate assembly protein W
MKKTYAAKLPLELDKHNQFIMVDDFLQNARQKLKMIIMTNPGERIMDPNFGVGIRKYLFETTRGIISDEMRLDDFTSKIDSSIKSQVKKYGGDTVINSVEVNVQEQTLYLKVNYNVGNYITDTLNLSVTM